MPIRKKVRKQKTVKRISKEEMFNRIKERYKTVVEAGVGKLQDKDLTAVKEVIENQSIKLTPERIKTLPASVLLSLIEERQSELKQLKIELITRVV